MNWRAALVEDEPIARRALRALVDEVPWLDCIGEADNGPAAVQLLEATRPQLVFLDIRIPGCDGFEVLRRCRHRPQVVFTTAFDRYAVAAFELGALDYLVKPFGRARFEKTLARVRQHALEAEEVPPASDRAMAVNAAPLRRLFARTGHRVVPIAIDAIVRIEARGDYAAIHHLDGVDLMHIALAELAARLDPERFCRIHRSHIVNLDRVTALQSGDDRRLRLTLDDGTQLIASREATSRLRQRFA